LCFYTADEKTKGSELNGGKHYHNFIGFYFIELKMERRPELQGDQFWIRRVILHMAISSGSGILET
jgi:hypothetical protein